MPGLEQSAMQECALEVIDLAASEGGTYRRRPGEVLTSMAEALGRDYYQVAHAVLLLDLEGLLQVERYSHSHRRPGRANKLTCVRLT